MKNIYNVFCIFTIIILILIFSSQAISSIPPHPRVKQMIKEGKIPIPYHLAHRDEALKRGINAPYHRALRKAEPRATARFLSSTVKALAILVRFTDNPSQVSAVYFDSLLFGANGRTLRNYYNEVSYSDLDIVAVDFPNTIGWKTMPQTYSYYVDGQNGFGGYPHNAQKLTEDAVAAVDAVVDFSQYDNDGDGYVDALFIIHSGQGAEFTGNPNHIWSHAWGTSSPMSVDGVHVYRYSTEPEYWRNPGDMTCGVYAHEAGHAVFGLPDLYDYDYDSEGLGAWSLMAGGSWNGYYGNSPSHPDAWSRWQMGFLTPVDVHQDTMAVDIPAVKENGTVYRLWKDGSSSTEYFLVENRQQLGYDAALPGSGLCIYHIDETRSGNNDQWYPGHTSYGNYKVALEQADGMWDLEKYQSSGDDGDPYPGSSNNRTFDQFSTPNSKNYLGQETYVAVRNISNSQTIMRADFAVEIVPPEIDVEPLSVAVTVSPSDTALRSVTIRNTGLGSLYFEIPLTSFEALQIQPKNGSPSERGITNTGGPDLFGYNWIDSDELGGPVFDWVDITSVGIPVTLTDDGSTGFISLGFDFPFYGRKYSQVSICSNGWISFTTAGDVLPISPLPSIWSPSNLIAIMGADMYPMGTCYYYSDVINERFIVEYYNWGLFGTYSPDYTMEIILEKSGRVRLQYLRMDGNVTGYVTGIQNATRDIGLMVGFGETYLKDSLAVEFQLNPQWLTIEPAEGTIPPGGSNEILLNFNSDEMDAGNHTGNISIKSNDQDEPTISVNVSLNVLDEPNISVSSESVDVGQVFLGTSKIETLIVRNRGTQNLIIDNIIPSDTSFKLSHSNFVVPPRAEQIVLVTFTPDTVGNIIDSLIIGSNDPQDPSIVVLLEGTVIHRPIISVTPESFSFTIPRGESDSAAVRIQNQGLGELQYELSIEPQDYIIGDSTVTLSSISSVRGNIYTVREVVTLQSFKSFLEIASPIDLYFAVYESETKSGPYSRIFMTQNSAEIGKEFYPSGPIDIKLQQGKYYFIGVANSDRITFYRQARAMPIDTSFGKIAASGVSGYYPPPTSLTPFIHSNMLWYQVLSLCPNIIDGIFPDSGTIASMNEREISFIINSTYPYGEHQTGFILRHNDPYSLEKQIPLSLTVRFPGISVEPQWNLVSIPMKATDLRKSSIFPSATSSAFTYRQGYFQKDSLQKGVGYWLKFATGDKIEIDGSVLLDDTIQVQSGWNIIGSLAYPIPVSTITSTGPGTILSTFIGYSSDGGYFNEDTLKPGKGYWIRMNGSATLILNSSDTYSLGKNSVGSEMSERIKVMTPSSNGVSEMSRLKFVDSFGNSQILYLDSKNDGIDIETFGLPPLPPTDVFDVRFLNQRNIEVATKEEQFFPILLNGGTYPLTIQWIITEQSVSAYLEFDNRSIPLEGEGALLITNTISRMILRISELMPLPKEFSLDQNHPNPFNPSTVISYQLPVESRVQLAIYNMLGQKVKTLVDEVQDAGYKAIEWNSTNNTGDVMASGIYFYRLDAVSTTDPNNSFHLVKKMLLMK